MSLADNPQLGRSQNGEAYEEETTHSMHNAIASWFLGPQAENKERLKTLFAWAVDNAAQARTSYYREDGVSIVHSQDIAARVALTIHGSLSSRKQ